MALIEGSAEIPESDQEELVHLLLNAENTSAHLKDRASRKLDQLSAGKLLGSAKKALENRTPKAK